jgi:thiamine kinase-like enzyme
MMTDAKSRVAALSCWQGDVDPVALDGGITNVNFTVVDGADKYVVRVGNDIPQHQVMRFNERAASIAAHKAGLSPEVVYTEPGILVIRFIEGKTLCEQDIARPEMLARIIPLLKTCHQTIPKYLTGPALIFWVFHVLRDYAHTLSSGNSSHLPKLERLSEIAANLEADVGAIEVVFGHNDLLAANFIDDGTRLWLIDWDYAGFNSPLFDLANLASNNGFSRGLESSMLQHYFDAPPGPDIWKPYDAMKCASLLRETMWSMVSEIHSDLDFDFGGYTAENLERFERTYSDYIQET